MASFHYQPPMAVLLCVNFESPRAPKTLSDKEDTKAAPAHHASSAGCRFLGCMMHVLNSWAPTS